MRFLSRFAALTVLAVSFTATAAPPPLPPPIAFEQSVTASPAPSHFLVIPAVEKLPQLRASLDVGSMLSPEVIATAIGILLSGLFAIIKVNDVKRRRLVATAAFHAYHIVKDLDEQGALNQPKVEAGLKAADDWMKANGWRPLADGEKLQTQLTFSSMTGQRVAAKELTSPSQAQA